MTDRNTLETIVAEFYGARAKLDLEKTMSFLDPDCHFRIAGTDKLKPFTQTVRTRPSITEFARALFDEWELRGLRTVSSHVDGDVVIVHRAGPVTHRPTGATFETETMDKFVFSGKHVIDYLQFVDTYAVAKTAGFQ